MLICEMPPQGENVCVESARFYFRYSNFSSRKWSIAVSQTESHTVKNIEEFPMKAYYISKEYWTIGRSIGDFLKKKLLNLIVLGLAL